LALGEAIAQAEETLLRTQQLLVHSRVLQERFAQPRRRGVMADQSRVVHPDGDHDA
jgi:hypothetical protein